MRTTTGVPAATHTAVLSMRKAYQPGHLSSVAQAAPRYRSGGGTEGKGGDIEGADARQSAARSTAPRRTHAQTTSSPSIMPLPAGEASRPPTASVYRIKQELDADGGSAVVGDAIAIGGLELRPPRRPLAGSACCTHASLLD